MAPVDYLKVTLHIKPHLGSRQLNCKLKGGLIQYACIEDGSIVDDHDEIADYINIKVDDEMYARIFQEGIKKGFFQRDIEYAPRTLDFVDEQQENQSLSTQLQSFEYDGHNENTEVQVVTVKKNAISLLKNPKDKKGAISLLKYPKENKEAISLLENTKEKTDAISLLENAIDKKEDSSVLENEKKKVISLPENEKGRKDKTDSEIKVQEKREEIVVRETPKEVRVHVVPEKNTTEQIDTTQDHSLTDKTMEVNDQHISSPKEKTMNTCQDSSTQYEEQLDAFEQHDANQETDIEYDIGYDFFEVIDGGEVICEEIEIDENNIVKVQELEAYLQEHEVKPESQNDLPEEPALQEVKEEITSYMDVSESFYSKTRSKGNSRQQDDKKNVQKTISSKQVTPKQVKRRVMGDTGSVSKKKKHTYKIKSPDGMTTPAKTLYQRKNNPTNASDVVTSINLHGISTFVCNLCGFHQAMPTLVYEHVKREHAIRDGPLSRMGLLCEGTPKKVLSNAAKILIDMGAGDAKNDQAESSASHEEKGSTHEPELFVDMGEVDKAVDDKEKQQSTNETIDSSKDAERKPVIETKPSIPDVVYGVFKRSLLESFVDNHFDPLDEEELVGCRYCKFQGSRKDDQIYKLLNHSRYTHFKLIERLTCIECMLYFSAIHLLKHHKDTVHGMFTWGKNAGLIASPSPQCYECQSTFKTVGQFESHMVNEHSVTHRFKCVVQGCAFSSSSAGGLNRHLTRGHVVKKEDREANICELCGFSSFARQGIEKHQARNCPGTLISNSKEVPYPCSLCNKHFPDERVLGRHIKDFHSGPYPCPYEGCPKEYNEACTLNTHIARSHQDRYHFVCDTCGAKLSDKTALSLHVKTVHKKIKDFVCPWDNCGQKFGRKNALEIHYRRHTGEKKLRCQYCSYSANQRASMNHHMKKQHPSSPYIR